MTELIFEELAYAQTPIGEISLRRRTEPRVENTVLYEVKLGDEFLMSSLFTEGERALATLGLSKVKGGALDVVVGGLGLGYTALQVLREERVRSLSVVEYLNPVIQWHERGLVPLGPEICRDERCRFVQGDFFALAADVERGFDTDEPGRRFDAILLDIDHAPNHWLHGPNAHFYTHAGLTALSTHLNPEGIFAMWSNDAPDDAFLAELKSVFVDTHADVVTFDNPYTGLEARCTIYSARRHSYGGV